MPLFPFVRLWRGWVGAAGRGVCGEPCPFFSVLLFGEVTKAGCGGPTLDGLQLLHEALLVLLIILSLLLLPGWGHRARMRKLEWKMAIWTWDRSLLSACVCYVCGQSRLIFLRPQGLYPPGSSVHRISWARILEWVAVPSSGGSSQPRDWTRVSCVSCTGRRILYLWCRLGSLAVCLLSCISGSVSSAFSPLPASFVNRPKYLNSCLVPTLNPPPPNS